MERKMKVKTLIKRLQKLADKHGNLPIEIEYEGDSGYIDSIFTSKSSESIVIWCYITQEQFKFNKNKPKIMKHIKSYLDTSPLRGKRRK